MKGFSFFTTSARDGPARGWPRLQRILHQKGWPEIAATAEQIHRNRIVVVPALRAHREYPGADGLITDVPRMPLGIFTADCAPIFVIAPAAHVVGVLHAGWRGVRGQILKQAVSLLRRRWACSPQTLFLEVGPCIGACCFEVQWDVARFFPYSRRRQKKGWTVNLRKEIGQQARRLKIPAAHIRISPVCTRQDHRYFSYRRNKTEHRQVSLIMAV